MVKVRVRVRGRYDPRVPVIPWVRCRVRVRVGIRVNVRVNVRVKHYFTRQGLSLE